MSDGFSNAVVGGAEFLIRSAIKSANYLAGIAGWRIAKDGTAELNNATVRGSLSAGGGTVLLNSGGLKIVDATHDHEINAVVGFLSRVIPDDGSFIQIEDSSIFFSSPTPTPGNGLTLDPGFIVAQLKSAAGVETPQLFIQTGGISGKQSTQILMQGQSSNSTVDNGSTNIEGGSASILIQGRASAVTDDSSIQLNATSVQYGTAKNVSQDGSTTVGTTTSTFFTNTLTTTGIHGVVFTSPPSGAVLVIGRATVWNNTAAQFCLLDFSIKQGNTIGSGGLIRGTDTNTAGVFQSSTANQEGEVIVTEIVTGLGSGNVLNAALEYEVVGSGTLNCNRRNIIVVPLGAV